MQEDMGSEWGVCWRIFWPHRAQKIVSVRLVPTYVDITNPRCYKHFEATQAEYQSYSSIAAKCWYRIDLVDL
jgi:hypothetical protein